MEAYAHEREALRALIERDEGELRRAVQDFREAVRRPLGLADRIATHPVPWICGGLLIGIWLGSRNSQRHP